MTLAVTLMVRDEADVVQQWLDHHVAQGVDVFVITDNGSVDGTTEVLTAFAAREDVVVDLRHDPVHRKQQSAVVTQMARDAYTVHHADWVVNADADEFLLPKDRSATLASVFAQLDPTVNAFVVPVVNMVGPLGESGAGLERLVWRDERSPEELRAVGLFAHPSGNAIHVGDAEVAVVQGNHLVTLPAGEAPPEELALEVLHFPWRSWKQYEHRVRIAGEAYTANPDHHPSPNHHGMRDYRRLQEGVLKAYFAVRHVSDEEAAAGHFRRDDSLVELFHAHGLPLSGPDEERSTPADVAAQLSRTGRALVARDVRVEDTDRALAAAQENVRLLEATVQQQHRRIQDVEALANQRERDLTAMRARRAVRWADKAGTAVRSARQRLGR